MLFDTNKHRGNAGLSAAISQKTTLDTSKYIVTY